MDDEITSDLNRNKLEMVADIVSAYVSNNHLQVADLPSFIASVHTALSGLGSQATAAPSASEKATAAQIKKSITPDALISFEDGKSYKTMRRHLTLRGLTPEAYRTKWGLPADYPMTAQSYSAQRSELARSLGLGQQSRKFAPTAVEAADTITETSKRRGRPPKVKDPV